MTIEDEFNNPGSKHYGIDPEKGYSELSSEKPDKRARYKLANGVIREYQVFNSPAKPGSYLIRSKDYDDQGIYIENTSFPVGFFDTLEEVLIFKQNFDRGHEIISSEGF